MGETSIAQAEIDVTTAIVAAKDFLIKVYQGEALRNVGLEEVVVDDFGDWLITVGFNRAWDEPKRATYLGQASSPSLLDRTYKIVKVDGKSGQAVYVKNRSPGGSH